MVIYKVIVQIEQNIENEWFEWMSTKHIPDVINTGCFLNFNFGKKLRDDNTPEGFEQYEIQYFCNSLFDYEEYTTKFSKSLQQEHENKYKGRFKAYREILEDAVPRMILANRTATSVN